jgi:hypothetical protein
VWVLVGRPTRDMRVAPFLFLLAVGSAVALAATLRAHWQRSAFEPPEVELVTARPRLGETVQFDVRIHAMRSARIRRVVAVLSCVEEVRDETGRAKVLPAVVHREDLELACDLTFDTPGPVFLHGRFAVPVDGMQSFESHLCAVRWRLEALVYIGLRVSFRERVELSVPPVCLSTERAPA